MIKAAHSAASWLADKVKANPKLNPIPYPFFKSIVNKQVEWARTQRGIRLEFEELAEAVRKELLKVGIHTMAESKKESKSERETSSLFEGTESGEAIPPLTFNLRTCGDFLALFSWLHTVFNSAEGSEVKLSAKITREARR